jgi:membrane-associated phospholipid phosphatase
VEAVSGRRRPAIAAAIAIAAVTAAAPPPARADELELHPRRTALLVVGGGLPFVLGETVFKDALSPDACRWCGSNALDRAIADGLRWDDPAAANTASNWTGFVLTPVLMVGGVAAAGAIDDQGDHALTDGLIVVESAILASDLTNLVKSLAGRERPFVHRLAAADKPLTASPQENNLSFFSGHSSLTMSLAVSAGTVASLRGYRLAPAVWGAGVGLALTTGYLRIAADKHWATDVVTGWVVGAAVGFAVPYYLHRKRTDPTLDVAVGPRTVALSFVW